MKSQRLLECVRELGHLEFAEPVRLASGDWSRHFVDGKRALARGSDLRLAAEAMIEFAASRGIAFDAAGGLTMGADQFAHAISLQLGDVAWFCIRKQPKERGTRQQIEGVRLGPNHRVLLVDDVVTRGSSILEALRIVRETGAVVVGAVAFFDRGAFGRKLFEAEGIPYGALLGYEDLGIPPIGSEPSPATAVG